MTYAHHQIHREQQNQKERQLTHCESAHSLVLSPKDGKHCKEAEQSKRQLDRRKSDLRLGMGSKKTEEVKQCGQGQEKLGCRYGNKKVSTEALKKREAHCANGSGGSAARADEK